MTARQAQRAEWYLDYYRAHGRLPSDAQAMMHLGVSRPTVSRDKQAIRSDGSLARIIVQSVAERAMDRYADPDDGAAAQGRLALDAAVSSLRLTDPPDPTDALTSTIEGSLGLSGVKDRPDIRAALEDDVSDAID